MRTELKNICRLVRDKISVSEITADNYISTENMLPDKCGITKPSALPTTAKVTAYRKNDILVSNIRPYFKKIWFAEYNGGCSNDVLVFRAEDGISPEFLYYTLADDRFFDYAMKTSTGTKMPRGDKKAIMKYAVNIPDYETQEKNGYLLRLLDMKIQLNNKINKNLEGIAQTIFNNMFPYVTSGKHTVGEYITLKRGKNLLSKNAVSGDIPVIAGGIKPATYHNKANTTAPVITVSASGANAGFVNLWSIPVWSSDSSFIDSSMTENIYFWYVLLKKRQKEIFDLQMGSAQPHIYPQHIAMLPIIELNKKDISEFNYIIMPLFNKIGENRKENQHLSALRDTLIPELINKY